MVTTRRTSAPGTAWPISARPKRLVETQDELLTTYGLPARVPRVDPKRVLATISLDKKARRGKVAWVLPRRMGHAEIGHAVPGALVRRVVTKALS